VHTKRCFYVILIGTPFLDFLFLDPKPLTRPSRIMGGKDAPVVRNQDLWHSKMTHRIIEHRKNASVSCLREMAEAKMAREKFSKIDIQ